MSLLNQLDSITTRFAQHFINRLINRVTNCPDIVLAKILLVVGCLPLTTPTFADPLPMLSKLPTHLEVKISPDGSKLASTIRVEEGIGVIVMETETLNMIGWLRPTRFEAAGFHWANNERLIIEIGQDDSWKEELTSFGELFAVNYDGTDGDYIFGVRAGDGRVGSRTSTREDQMAWGSVIDPLPHDQKHILVSSEPISRSGSEIPTVMRVNVKTGKSKKVIRAPITKPYYLTDHTGEVRIAMGTTRDNEVQAFYRQPGKRQWQAITGVNNTFYPAAISTDNNELTFLSDNGGDRTALTRMNLKTGERQIVYEHPEVDITGVLRSADRQATLALQVDPGFTSYLIIDKAHQETAMFRAMLAQFPGMRVAITSQSNDGTAAIIEVNSAVYPGYFYLYKNGELKFLFKRFPELIEEQLIAAEPIELEARDGLTLHGYLTRATSSAGPLVVLVHGGPHYVRDYWAFDPDVQMLATAGINVLQVNFRGSGGYGSHFSRAGFGEWGGKIQHDIIDAAQWAIDKKIAAADQLCIMGTSFGGYSAVQAATLAPDLFQCGVAVSGIYDLSLLFSRGDVQQTYFGQAYLEEVLGTDTTQLAAFSPINHVDKLKAKLLIVHGTEDQRAPVIHARKLIKALEKSNKPFEARIEDKEGHGFFSAENKLAYYRVVKQFLAEALALNETDMKSSNVR